MDYVFIAKNVYIFAKGNIKIGNFCTIGSGSKLISSSHFYAKSLPIRKQQDKVSEIILEEDVWLGFNVVILPGVELKKGCLVAAGSVVTKSFSEYTIIGGIPARKIGERE